jgi:long-chain fatty acid transport protein
MRRISYAALIFIISGTSQALAAGYGLKEESADAMGAAYAGSAAGGPDASYLAYNPAALGQVQDFDLSVSGIGILPGSRGHYSTALTSAGTPTGGGMNPSGYVSDAIVPAFALRYRLNDQWAVGVSVNAPDGLRTDYPREWAGRYYAEKTELLTIDMTPTVSYEPVPGLILGAGMQIEFAKGTLTSAIDTGTLGFAAGIPGSIPGKQDSFASLSGNNWTEGYTVGAIYSFTPDLTMGIAYHSSMQQDLSGREIFHLDSSGIGATINALTGAFANTHGTAPVVMPDNVNIGARFKISDEWTGLAELDWINWSRFHNLTITSENPAQPPDITDARWHSTVFGSLGAEYRPSEDWLFRGGVGYDESPSNDVQREPRIPDTSRIWLAFGVRYAWNDSTDISVSAAHLFTPHESVAQDPTKLGNAARGVLIGDTTAYVDTVGLQVSWRPSW